MTGAERRRFGKDAGVPGPVRVVRGGAMSRFTRGFTGRGQSARSTLLPPGQYDTGRDWPVLTAEPTPDLAPQDWWFAIEGLVDTPTRWTWDEMHELPLSTYEGA